MAGFSISEFLISAVELVEAQADDIKASFVKSAGSIIALCVVAIIAVVGFIFLLLGLNLAFQMWVGKLGAYFLTSGAAFLLSFIIYMVYLWKTKK